MEAKHDTAGKVINGRINGRFAPGYSGNPGGSPEATLEPIKRKPNRLILEADTAVGPRERKPRKRKVPSPPAA